ncbi:MAG TPA: Lrp/AsnC family transcriptional regulator [Candidatus Bathyarchaeota archaeon]|nr:Lrp/AsnC family transcriptional regulator [Candidatus Bathyarchaeota archaeon]
MAPRGKHRKELDEKDRRILEILMERGRATFRELARELGMSDVAIRKRVLRLERSGIISGYTALVDPRALGFSVISLTGVDVEPGELLRVARELVAKDYVRSAWLTTGDHEIMLEVWARDEAEMDAIIEEIKAMDGVVRVCPAVVIEKLKPRGHVP